MEIKIPEVGESILEALVANWMKEDGDAVAKDEIICELETDKVNVELPAEASGILHIVIPVGQTVPIGTVIATLEEGDVEVSSPQQTTAEKTAESAPVVADTVAATQSSQPPANPAARQQAEERAIDLNKVAGSGRAGRSSSRRRTPPNSTDSEPVGVLKVSIARPSKTRRPFLRGEWSGGTAGHRPVPGWSFEREPVTLRSPTTRGATGPRLTPSPLASKSPAPRAASFNGGRS